MAEASGVSMVIEVGRLPLLPGARELVRRGNRTRASRSNRVFAEAALQVEAAPDPLRTEFLFDPQTSGGLLISVSAEQAERVVQQAQAAGATAACVVGSVIEQQPARLVIRP
jgi:selenide,water dikinase